MHTIKIEGGGEMPCLGLGTWKIEGDKVQDVICNAITAGYRGFDMASEHGNETQIGEAFKKCFEKGVCRREDLFLTCKLWNTYHAKDHVRAACERTLKDLGVNYLDLYFIHFPISLKYVPIEERYPPGWVYDPKSGKQMPEGLEFENVTIRETWEAMEKLVDDGLVKAIGVANFNCALMMDLLKYARIKPAVWQVELHPYLQQPMLLEYAKSRGIAVSGYSPLGALSYHEMGMYKDKSVLDDPCITKLADKHGKSTAQIALRWGLQRGAAVVVKTETQDRMEDDMNVFDFELDETDMKGIQGIDKGMHFNDPGVYAKIPIFA
eukprot:jgi/Mesvir1/18544/Mv17063-RA.2